MSTTVDVNVLLHASHAASERHDEAVGLLERLAEGPDLVVLFWPVLLGYLRIATHPSVFERPLDPDVAAGNVERLLDRPHVRALGELDGFWTRYRAVTAGQVVRGNLVPDAHVVALMRQHGVETIWTHDRDFRRFDGIRVADPFTDG